MIIQLQMYIWIRNRSGEEGMETRGWKEWDIHITYQPMKLLLSTEVWNTSIGVICHLLGREGSLVKQTKNGRVGSRKRGEGGGKGKRGGRGEGGGKGKRGGRGRRLEEKEGRKCTTGVEIFMRGVTCTLSSHTAVRILSLKIFTASGRLKTQNT